MIVLLFGPPGVGKGTQADLLTKKFNLTVCSTGNILREEITRKTELGMAVKTFLDKGELVHDEYLFKLIEQFLYAYKNNSMLFDGFPRNINQAEVFDTLLSQVDLKLDAALELYLSVNEIVARLEHRRYCSTCGRTFNLLTNRPSKENLCDICGTALMQRSDDTEEVIRRRMKIYDRETHPLIDYYTEKNIYHQISARGPQKEVFQRIALILNGNID